MGDVDTSTEAVQGLIDRLGRAGQISDADLVSWVVVERDSNEDRIAALVAERDEARAEAERAGDTLSQRVLFDECETAGWDAAKLNTFAEEIAHLHDEVAEAFRAWRLTKSFDVTYDADGKPQGVPIEFADVLIGLFYNAELHGFDLWEAVRMKHAFNLGRSYPSEGRQLHPQPPEAPAAGTDGGA